MPELLGESEVSMTATPETPERPSRWRPLPGDPPALRRWLAEKDGSTTADDDWPDQEPR